MTGGSAVGEEVTGVHTCMSSQCGQTVYTTQYRGCVYVQPDYLLLVNGHVLDDMTTLGITTLYRPEWLGICIANVLF